MSALSGRLHRRWRYATGLLFLLLFGTARCNKELTSHIELFNTENSVPLSCEPRFQCSRAMGDCLLNDINADYVHHHESSTEQYWSGKFREEILYKYFIRVRHWIYKVRGRTELGSLDKGIFIIKRIKSYLFQIG